MRKFSLGPPIQPSLAIAIYRCTQPVAWLTVYRYGPGVLVGCVLCSKNDTHARVQRVGHISSGVGLLGSLHGLLHS